MVTMCQISQRLQASGLSEKTDDGLTPVRVQALTKGCIRVTLFFLADWRPTISVLHEYIFRVYVGD
jgi:hypothetical protein